MHLLTAAAMLVLVASITGCKSSRVWANKDKDDREERREERREEQRDDRMDDRMDDYRPAPPPPARSYSTVPLIITPTPGFVMKQTPEGRYYHRSPQGLLYWKGANNRFCLDRMYLSRVSYSRWEYEEWRRYSM